MSVGGGGVRSVSLFVCFFFPFFTEDEYPGYLLCTIRPHSISVTKLNLTVLIFYAFFHPLCACFWWTVFSLVNMWICKTWSILMLFPKGNECVDIGSLKPTFVMLVEPEHCNPFALWKGNEIGNNVNIQKLHSKSLNFTKLQAVMYPFRLLLWSSRSARSSFM